MGFWCFPEKLLDSHAGIERCHRVLKDHLDCKAKVMALFRAHGVPINAFPEHLAVTRRSDAGNNSA